MMHLVFGTGLVGGFIAGGLLQQGFETRLLGRKKHQTSMREGLILTDSEGNEARLKAPKFWQPDDQPVFNCLWLTVKCGSVNGCIEQLKEIVHRDTIIICCQNGFSSSQPLREEFKDNLILNAIIGFNVVEHGDSHLHRSTDGHLIVESNQKIDHLIEKLDSALLPAKVSKNILAERWAKLQLNLSNPVNALADIPTKAMTEDAEYRNIIAALMRELLSVTRAMNLSLPRLTAVPAAWLPAVMELPNFLYLKLAQKMLSIDPTARQSMWWDLSQGKKSEIQFLNQSVIKQGEQLGIDCPVNKKIVELIKAVERGEEKIGFSAAELTAKLLS